MLNRSRVKQSDLDKVNNIINKIYKLDNRVDSKLKVTFPFKGRKSSLIAMYCIDEFSDEGNYVLDPFLGSGSFLLATKDLNVFFDGVELDNFTFNILSTLLLDINEDRLNQILDNDFDDARKYILELYETNCCGEKNHIKKLYFDNNPLELLNPLEHRDFSNGENIKMMTRCSICGKDTKAFDDSDMEKWNQYQSLQVDGFPDDEYIENSRINITKEVGQHKYEKRFLNRSKLALLKLQEAVDALEESSEKTFLQYALVASLALAGVCMYGSSTDSIYYIPRNKNQESNVLTLFENKVRRFLAFNKDNLTLKSRIDDETVSLFNSSYKIITSDVDNVEKYDLIYTDFPYTDQEPYLERNQLYRVWLNKFVSDEISLSEDMLNEEIVVTNAPSRRNKGSYDQYYDDIDTMFSEFYKVLKNNKYVVLTLKLGAKKYFDTYYSIIELARKNGFEYVSHFGIEKDDPSLFRQAAVINSTSTEFIVVLKKLCESEKYLYIERENFEVKVSDIIYKMILENDYSVSLNEVAIKVKEELPKMYELLNDAYLHEVKKVVTRYFEYNEHLKTVTLNDNFVYYSEKSEHNLFRKTYDIIPVVIKKLLTKNSNGFKLDDLYYELMTTVFSGDRVFNDILNENDNYANKVKMLLLNYCELDGDVYKSKTRHLSITEGDIDISSLDGYEFEELVKDLLIEEGYENVVRKGGAGDLGVDIICMKNEKRIIIQCKRWVSNVGSTPIQRLHSMREMEDYDLAICLTTSDYTADGKKVAENTNVKLINGVDVLQMLQKHYPGVYYSALLQEELT